MPVEMLWNTFAERGEIPQHTNMEILSTEKGYEDGRYSSRPLKIAGKVEAHADIWEQIVSCT